MRMSHLVPSLRRAAAIAAVAALPLGLASCGGDGDDLAGPDDDEIAGSWSGSFTVSGVTATLAFTATEANGQVSGNGSLSANGESLPLTMTGTFAAPDVALTFASAGFEPMSFTGTMSDGRISGALNGSGFTGQTLTLTRGGADDDGDDDDGGSSRKMRAGLPDAPAGRQLIDWLR